MEAALDHCKVFTDVQDCVSPSSQTSEARGHGSLVVGSAVVEECKEIVRHMLGGRKASLSPLFKKKDKDHLEEQIQKPTRQGRINYPYLVLNHNRDYDATKCNGRVVCFFDDYSTVGNSFESARSLLLAMDVKRVVMVALGKFGFNCQYETFCITDDPFTASYTWHSIKRQQMNATTDMHGEAIMEFTRLKDLVKLRQ